MMRTDFDYAEMAFARGDHDAVFNHLAAVMASDGVEDPRVLPLLAESLSASGLALEAVETLEQAARNEPEQAPKHWLRALAIAEPEGLDDKAFLLSLQLIQHQPNHPDVVFALVKGFELRGEMELLDQYKNRLVASNDPKHLQLAIRLIGDDVRNEHNLVLFKKMRHLFPEDRNIRFALMDFAREFSDLATLEAEMRLLRADLAAGQRAFLKSETPHYALMWSEDEGLNRLATNVRSLPDWSPDMAAARHARPHDWAEKIRVGYLSSDFWADHATMRLLQGVLEAHDAERFDVTPFCYTPERFIAMDQGNRSKWGRIVSVRDLSDAEAAALIRAHRIDILVDLKGHTGGSRPGIVNAGPAPLQVAWLGFPGSSVNIDCDYIIGDRFVTPDSAAAHYHETFCRLPHSYQPNESRYRALPAPKTRAELGLPQDAFVFAEFNSPRKITPESFDLWMAILQKAPNSVLWLMCDSRIGRHSLVERANRAGISANRLIFAPKCDYVSHIARLQAADLGLDTFPCNGHTTTSDMLWAGLPVLTVKGTSFAGRVSESLLNAIDLPELVAADVADYVEKAVALAASKSAITALKKKLSENKTLSPLFQAEVFCRNLERAFEMMVARAKAGLPVAVMDVE